MIAQHAFTCGETDSPVPLLQRAAAACRSDRRKSDMAMRYEPHTFWIEFGLGHAVHRRILATLNSSRAYGVRLYEIIMMFKCIMISQPPCFVR